MAVGVVNVLEAIQIQKNYSQLMFDPLGMSYGLM